jgi:peroxiredoxin
MSDSEHAAASEGERQQAPPFEADSSRGQVLDDARFRGKVPFVLVFTADLQEPATARLVNELDRQQHEFGERRVQLMVVVPDEAAPMQRDAEQRSVTLPLLADPTGEMAARYGATPATRTAEVVVVDRHGDVVDRLAISGEQAAENLVEEVRGLMDRYPERMVVE